MGEIFIKDFEADFPLKVFTICLIQNFKANFLWKASHPGGYI